LAATAVVIFSLLVACSDETEGDAGTDASGDGGADAGSAGDAGRRGDSGASTDADTDGGVGGDIDAGWTGPCPPTLAERLRVTEIPSVMRSRLPTYLDPLGDGGARLAYLSGGEIRIARLDAREQVEATVATEGNDVSGLVSHGDGAALLVYRDPDVMVLVRIEEDGTERFTTTMVGEVDHSVVGSKYITRDPHYGRLRWTGDGYAAYLGHNQTWDDGIGHQGDLLWYYDASGARREGGWDWGCSHSLAVRFHYHQGLDSPFTSCDSEGGVYLNGSFRTLIPDADHGGGIAPLSDGVLVAYSHRGEAFNTNLSIARVGADLSVSEQSVVSTEGPHLGVHLAPYGPDAYLVGWIGGSTFTPWDSFGQATIALINADGSVVIGPENVAAGASPREDYVVLANGDIAWTAYPAESTSTWPLAVVRMRVCE